MLSKVESLSYAAKVKKINEYCNQNNIFFAGIFKPKFY